MSPAFVAGGIVFARVRFLATKRFSLGFAVRRERQSVSFTFAALLFRNFPCANNSALYLSLSVLFCFYVFQVEMVAGKNARGVKLSASVSPYLTCRSSVWQENAGGLFGDQHLIAWAAVVLISSVLTV